MSQLPGFGTTWNYSSDGRPVRLVDNWDSRDERRAYKGEINAWKRQRRQQRNNPQVDGTNLLNGSSPEQNINSLLQRQLSETERLQEQQINDRDAAVSLLGNSLGGANRSQEYLDALEMLQSDPSETPFGRALRGSITETLENPDVYTQQQMDNFESRSNERVSQAVSDALRATNVDSARRGLGNSGLQQGNQQALMMQGVSELNQQLGDMDLQRAELRAQNLQTAQNLGVNLESATMQERGRRLSAMAGIVSDHELRDLETISTMAEILSSTEYITPDYSGIASVQVALQQSANDLVLQRENLALLEQQIASNERVGLRSIEAQNALARAQADAAASAREVQSQIDGLFAAFEEQNTTVEGEG